MVALDEVQIPGRPQPERIPSAKNLQGLLQQIEALSKQRAAQPRLVLYPAGHPQDVSTRRFLTDQLLVHFETGQAVAPLA
jgi:hypothetical protein